MECPTQNNYISKHITVRHVTFMISTLTGSWGGCCFCVHFTAEETEAWGLSDGSKVTQLGRAEWDSSPGRPDSSCGYIHKGSAVSLTYVEADICGRVRCHSSFLTPPLQAALRYEWHGPPCKGGSEPVLPETVQLTPLSNWCRAQLALFLAGECYLELQQGSLPRIKPPGWCGTGTVNTTP